VFAIWENASKNFVLSTFLPEQAGKIYFGAWVEIENDDGEQKTLRIVGIDEIYDHHPAAYFH
jgi:transcription elongation GreA/GreB family factor